MPVPNRSVSHFILFLALSLIALTQTTWWTIFQFRTTNEWQQLQEQTWRYQTQALYTLLQAHESRSADAEQELLAAFPDLTLTEDRQQVMVRAESRQRLLAEIDGRRRMFLSEGIFFAVLLLVGISYMYWTLRRERMIDQLQSSWLAATSHELRTPVTSIRLMLDTLALRSLPEEQYQDFIQRMQQDLERLNDQLDSLLYAQSILKDGPSFMLRPVAMSEATLAVCEEMEPRFQQKQLEFDYRIAPGLQIEGDEERWHHVVKNLLDNAFKYTDQGSVTVELTGDEKQICLLVSDTGCGFSHGEGRRLFRRFYRGEAGEKKRARGTGLGLYLVRHFVEAFNGEVKASSRGPGRGASFMVLLPALQDRGRSEPSPES